jgi:hypothetical protein
MPDTYLSKEIGMQEDDKDPIEQHREEIESQQHAPDPKPEAEPRTVRVRCGMKTEVYSRVVGYYRPTTQWNKGKQSEFEDRVEFKLPGEKPGEGGNEKRGAKERSQATDLRGPAED